MRGIVTRRDLDAAGRPRRLAPQPHGARPHGRPTTKAGLLTTIVWHTRVLRAVTGHHLIINACIISEIPVREPLLSLWPRSDTVRRVPTSKASLLAYLHYSDVNGARMSQIFLCSKVAPQEETGTNIPWVCHMGPLIGSTRLCQGWQHARQVHKMYCACCGSHNSDMLALDTAHAACRPAHAQPGLVRRIASPVCPQAPRQVPAPHHSHVSQKLAEALHIQHWCALLRADSTSQLPAASELLI